MIYLLDKNWNIEYETFVEHKQEFILKEIDFQVVIKYHKELLEEML